MGYIGQEIPFDATSGFSGQYVFGPVRIDLATGDLTHDTGEGIIFGFNVGASGYSGFSGFSGSSGFSGTGFSGPSGPSGPSGFSGYSGESGFSGNSGASGLSGSSGISGFSGLSGISGTSGWSGISDSGSSGSSGISGFSGQSGFSGTSGFSGFSGLSFGLQMGIGGRLPQAGLPISGLGIEICPITTMIQYLRGRRVSPGTTGTTTVQLEVNGSPVTGATLSWASTDPAFTLKTAIFTPTLIGPGDYISLRLTSSETNAEDVLTEAN